MSVILDFVALVLAGDAVVVMISAAVEHFSKAASLFVFFGLFAVTFWIAWIFAVRITERFIIRSH
jgi:hypothetical protein